MENKFSYYKKQKVKDHSYLESLRKVLRADYFNRNIRPLNSMLQPKYFAANFQLPNFHFRAYLMPKVFANAAVLKTVDYLLFLAIYCADENFGFCYSRLF